MMRNVPSSGGLVSTVNSRKALLQCSSTAVPNGPRSNETCEARRICIPRSSDSDESRLSKPNSTSVGISRTLCSGRSESEERTSQNEKTRIPNRRPSRMILRFFVLGSLVISVVPFLIPVGSGAKKMRSYLSSWKIKESISEIFLQNEKNQKISSRGNEGPSCSSGTHQLIESVQKLKHTPDVDFADVETLRNSLTESLREVEKMKQRMKVLENEQKLFETRSSSSDHLESSVHLEEIQKLKEALQEMEVLSQKSNSELKRKLEIAQQDLQAEQMRINEISRRLNEDMEADFATSALGAVIVHSMSSISGPKTSGLILMLAKRMAQAFNSERYRSVFMSPRADVSVVIDPTPLRGPGDCFFSSNSAVNITMEFPIPITLKRVGVKHISKAIDPVLDVAPKDFRIFVFPIENQNHFEVRNRIDNDFEFEENKINNNYDFENENDKTEIHVGDFEFRSLTTNPSSQLFDVNVPSPIKRVRFEFLNSRGNSGICIYRLNALGNLEWRMKH